MLENASRQFFLVLLALIAGGLCVALLDPVLGTDLKGGTQLLYEVPADVLEELVKKEGISKDKVMQDTQKILRERIDPNGTLEPLIARSGENGILIELNYFEDPQERKRVLDRIGNLGELEMRIVADGDYKKDNIRFNMQREIQKLQTWLQQPENRARIEKDPKNIRLYNEAGRDGPDAYPNLAWYPRRVTPQQREDAWYWNYSFAAPGSQSTNKSTVKFYTDAEWNNGLVPEAVLAKDKNEQFLLEFVAINMHETCFTGENLDPSGVGVGVGRNGGPGVNYKVQEILTDDYANWSEEYIGKASAIILNGEIKSAPTFQGKINGVGIIEGDFTRQEVEELVKVLRTGSLRVEPIKLSEHTIGPTLGAQSIFKGLISIVSGGLLVFLFMLYYYRVAGAIACVSLLMNVLLLYAGMLFMQATLTLPGLGGIVLTLGMAVDANVLIYERIREELQKGKEMLQAVRAGFERAMSAILDSNITTFLVGIVLFNVGTGPVRGFAVTLMIGIVTTVFTQFFVSRLLFHYALEKKKLEGWMPRTLFENRNIDFVRHIKKCVGVSSLVILFGLGYSVFVAPREVTLGIDFTGGANLRMVVAQGVTTPSVREKLRADDEFRADYPNATVNSAGDPVDGTEDKFTQFNVRLKLTDAQRDEISAARKQWREVRNKANKENLTPPEPFVPPYVVQLERMFGDQLVKPAFSDPLITPDPRDTANRGIAQIDVHFSQPVLVAGLTESLGKALSECEITSLPTAGMSDAKDVRIEWNVQNTVKQWQLANLIGEEIKLLEVKNIHDKPVVLSDPFPEASEIQGRLVNELRNAAIGALLLAWGLIVLYLRVRFHEYKYGVAAVVALIHDVLVTFGIVVLCNNLGLVHAEISLAMLACFLTIIGYSVNDTIVVFDRIRENRIDNARAGTDESFRSLINRSLNQTLSRTVLTTVLTLFVVIAQLIVNYGSETDLEAFAFAMTVGMISGVYSTMYIAAPILIWLDKGEPVLVPEEPVDPHAVDSSDIEAELAEKKDA